MLCLPHRHLLQHPQRGGGRRRAGPQRAVRADTGGHVTRDTWQWSRDTCAEHHQREDLPGAVVVVRLPRPPHRHLHRLQDRHHLLPGGPLRPPLQDGEIR